MFTRKASRHDTSTSAPPTPGPSPDRCRSSRRTPPGGVAGRALGNVVATSARPVGLAIAAPTPQQPGDHQQGGLSQATPHSTEAMVNSATLAMKVRLRLIGIAQPSAQQHQTAEGERTYAVITSCGGVGQGQFVLDLR